MISSAEDDIVQTLYMEKLIHRMPAAYYNPDDERRYQYFQLDYGTTIDRLMANAATDARTSYDSSKWAKVISLGGKWLTDLAREMSVGLAPTLVLIKEEAGRIDIEPREIIFLGERVEISAPISGSGESMRRSRRRHP